MCTVLFADLVGSTSLAERLDPEDFRELAGGAVARVVEAVDTAGGDVIEIAGDGVLAVFESAAKGVAAARLATQRVAAHAAERVPLDTDLVLAVRVGVATGPVRTLTVDLGQRRVRRISGETVARATELEAGAPPGSALLDGSTLAAADSADFVLGTIEESDLPDAYRLVADTGPADPPEGASPRSAHEREERRTIYAVFVGLIAPPGADDPDGLLAAAAEPVAVLVERFGGTVKDAAGASVVAMFGAPVAHEDDAERAVRMAIVAIDTAAEAGVAARVGVASGVVVVGKLGAGRHAEYAASGDAMNTAARLHLAAPPDEVLVTDQVHHALRDLFAWSDPRSLRVKGKAEPLEVRRPLRPLDATTRGDVLPTAESAPAVVLFGRDDQRRALEVLLDRVVAGASGTVIVAGDAGVGKTSLVDSFRTRSQTPLAWVSVRGRSWATNQRFGTMAQIERDLDLAGALREATPEAAAERVAAATADWFRAIVDAGLKAVLAVDDLHAVDLASVEVVARLAEQAIPGVLVLVTTRDETRGDEWTARLRDRAEVVRLGPLDDADARMVLDGLIGTAVLPFAIEQRVLKTAAGSPSFLQHLVGSLVDEGRLVHTPTGWHHVPGPVEIPDTVQRARLARIDALPADVQAVLLAAAVLRSGFDEELVAAVADVERSDVDDAFAILADRRFIERTGRDWLVSSGVEEAATNSMVRRTRRDLHRRAAEALEAQGMFSVAAAALARHWTEANEPSRATEPALVAAEAARRRFSYDEAAELQRLARDGAPTPRAAEIGLGLGALLAAAARYDEAMAAFAAAADEGGISVLAASAVGYEDALFASRRLRGGPDDRSVELLEAAAIAVGSAVTPIAVRVHAALARAMAYRSSPDAASRADHAVDLARRTDDPAVLAYAFVAWRAAHEGPDALAPRRGLAREMINAAASAGDDALTIEVQRLALIDDLAAGDLIRADATIAALSDRIVRLGRADQAWYPPMWRALRMLWSGDLEAANDAITAFRQEGRRVGYGAVEQVYALQLHLLRRRQGRADEVVPLYARLLERVGDRWVAFSASLAVAVGDLDAARRLVEDVDLDRVLPPGLTFAPAAALFTDALEALAADDLAAQVAHRLAPWSGQFAVVGAGAACTGPVDLTLGRLAAITGNPEASRAHFSAARRLAVASLAPLDVDDATAALAALQ